MTTHLVTFSDESMSRSRELCAESGKRNGIDYVVTQHAEAWLPAEARQLRGLGHWRWKPDVILNSMNGHIRTGDTLIYADAGIEFIDNVSHIIERMDQDIFLFGNNWEHAHWCKRDVIDAVWKLPPDSEGNGDRVPSWQRFGKQCQASVIFFRVSDYTRSFVAEWLKWCLFEGGRLIDDSPSRLPNHPEFREHRHDQAILTTLAYREGIPLHWWPAIYNDGAFTYEKLPEYAGDAYPAIFHHHRRRNIDWEQGRLRFNASARTQTRPA